MRLSSPLLTPSAVATLSITLLWCLTGAAMSQTAPSSALPSVTVVAPKQVARTPHRRDRTANDGAARRIAPAAQTATLTPPPARGSVFAQLKELERTSNNCIDGCQSSFKHGNQPWNGCSTTGDNFSATCRNVHNFKSYADCEAQGLLTGWHRNAIWWYCTSLLAGNKLVAELKPSRH